MSIYDNFRAPQYVDFAGIHGNDTDASSFFDGDSDMDVTPSVSPGFKGSSVSSFDGTISDGDSTLTPSRFNSSTNRFGGDFCMDDNANKLTTQSVVIHVIPATPYDTSSKLNRKSESSGAGCTPSESPLNENFNIPRHRESTPMVHHVNTQAETKKVNFGSPLRKSCRFAEPDSSSGKITKADSAGNGTRASRKSSSIGAVTPHSNRRSRSASSSKVIPSDEEIVLDAMRALSVGSSHKKSSCGTPIETQASPNLLVSEILSNETMLSCLKGAGPKRKLSPPPKNARDYSQPPEKYISMAEQIARIQKQTPKRFRTLPSAAALKRGVQSKVARSLSTESSSVSAPKYSKAQKSKKGSDDTKGVRVGRWPQPKVEPFVLTEYKKQELPKTILNFENREKVLVRDRKTPIKRLRPSTIVQPFSFDKRDQELLRKKLERAKGVEPQSHCCQSKAKRRSRSVGDETSRIAVNDPLVHHARIPTVLHKPPFVPQKKPHKVTRPIDHSLRTEMRAREREEFDQHVRAKEEERYQMIMKQQEEKRLQEEREILKRRKEIVHKARPVPTFRPFKVQPSNAPLTEPSTPKFLRHSKSEH